MADTAVKKYYDEAQRVIDEQAILDKYNAATVAQFNVQREQNRQAENQFYNEMYNTQKTAMDTIRQSNAAAVASGASRGVQAAQELSSLLGLQQESVASATELAQANRQTAQEETAAVLENVLNAYKQATADRQQYVQSAIEAESLLATQASAAAQQKEAETNYERYLLDLKVNDPAEYYRKVAEHNSATAFENMSEEQLARNRQSAAQALSEVMSTLDLDFNDFNVIDFGTDGADKVQALRSQIRNIYTAYGLSNAQADLTLKSVTALMKQKKEEGVDFFGGSGLKNAGTQYMQAQFDAYYLAKYMANKK